MAPTSVPTCPRSSSATWCDAMALPTIPVVGPSASGSHQTGNGGLSLSLSPRVPRTGLCPPASHPDGFSAPSAPPSLLEALWRGNWTQAEPSPPCQCSGPGAHRMLPECPEGAGGLPPPQVTPSPVGVAPRLRHCRLWRQVMLRGGHGAGCPSSPSVHPAGAEGHRGHPSEPDRQEHLRLPGEDLPPDHPAGVSAGAWNIGDIAGTLWGHQGNTPGTPGGRGHCWGHVAGWAGAALMSPWGVSLSSVSPRLVSFRLRNKKWVNEQR